MGETEEFTVEIDSHEIDVIEHKYDETTIYRFGIDGDLLMKMSGTEHGSWQVYKYEDPLFIVSNKQSAWRNVRNMIPDIIEKDPWI